MIICRNATANTCRPAGRRADRTRPPRRRSRRAAVSGGARAVQSGGAEGIRQVNVRGLVVAAFTHRDSRSGDPDLHTHVAVANKVQTLDGRWLSIDGRVLFKATVAASETTTSPWEHHLRDQLGVRLADRPDTDPGKRPVREIVGVDRTLNEPWSTRSREPGQDRSPGQIEVVLPRALVPATDWRRRRRSPSEQGEFQRALKARIQAVAPARRPLFAPQSEADVAGGLVVSAETQLLHRGSKGRSRWWS